MNEKARHFLAQYQTGGEIEGGLLFAKALQQANLDGNEASLDRIEALLSQLRAKRSPEETRFLADPAAVNFCLMLAFYLGDY
ncbi:hypothetical protein, partial [Chitinimonas sp.]|uniref:hypothetical protein n=1 Tax=Chitinimonas sp. TaxID=1934313 RepID=UPI0035B02830